MGQMSPSDGEKSRDNPHASKGLGSGLTNARNYTKCFGFSGLLAQHEPTKLCVLCQDQQNAV